MSLSTEQAFETSLSRTAVERLRARLNHDLLKNRLILGLHRLNSMMRGKIESPESIVEAIQEVSSDWLLAQHDALLFSDFLQRNQEFQDTMRLPFVRMLLPEEKQVIHDLLLSNVSEHMLADQNDCFTSALAAAGLAFDGLRSVGSSGSTDAVIEAIETSLRAVRALSECLGSLRLSI